MAFGDWLKGVGETITENLGTVIEDTASQLFSGQAAKAKAEAEKAQAELEAYKSAFSSISGAQTSYVSPTVITTKTNGTMTQVIDFLKKWWWVGVVLIGVWYFFIKKKSRVKPKRRKRSYSKKSNPSSKPRKRGSGTKTKGSKTRKLKGRTYPFATKEDRRKYMEKVRNLRG
jgi:hypothetical protein